jgi:hypothetical protein
MVGDSDVEVDEIDCEDMCDRNHIDCQCKSTSVESQCRHRSLHSPPIRSPQSQTLDFIPLTRPLKGEIHKYKSPQCYSPKAGRLYLLDSHVGALKNHIIAAPRSFASLERPKTRRLIVSCNQLSSKISKRRAI